jgi:hypothetical protein
MSLWFWYVLAILALVVVLYKIVPKYMSNRTHCFKSCFHFRNKECYYYGKGHLAKYPCNEHLERNKTTRS